MVSRNKESLEEFIKIYESEACLWHIKSKDYHDRTKKEAAYARLIHKLKDIEPNANKELVIKKINNIRSSYRKECKKIKASIKSGSGTDEVYEPKLWYFKLLRFLNDQDNPRSSRSNIESDDDEADIGEHAIENTSGDNANSEDIARSAIFARDENVSEPNVGTSIQTHENRPTPPKRRVQAAYQESLANDVLLTVKDHFKRPIIQDDRFDIVGKNIAMKLRALPKQQMLIAENIINETLFEAEISNLTLSHKLICEAIPQNFEQQIYQYQSPTPSSTLSPSALQPITPTFRQYRQQEVYPSSSTNPNPNLTFRTVPYPNTPRPTPVHQKQTYPLAVHSPSTTSSSTPSPILSNQNTPKPTTPIPKPVHLYHQQEYSHPSATESATLFTEQYQEEAYSQQSPCHNDILAQVPSHEESAALFLSNFSDKA